MPNMNSFYLAGHLGRDAELRYTKSNRPFCTFSLAVNYGYGDNKKAAWVECKCWGQLAEAVGTARKGAGIYVAGHIEQDEWTTQDGQKRSRLVFVCDTATVDDRPPRPKGGANDTSGPRAEPAPNQAKFEPVDENDPIPF